MYLQINEMQSCKAELGYLETLSERKLKPPRIRYNPVDEINQYHNSATQSEKIHQDLAQNPLTSSTFRQHSSTEEQEQSQE
jgi:hypothetical protein